MYTRTILSSISDSDSVNDVPSSWVTLSKLELDGKKLRNDRKRHDGSDPERLGYFVSQFLSGSPTTHVRSRT